MSYRSRGKKHRQLKPIIITQIKNSLLFKKTPLVITPKIKINKYSPIKIKAKYTPTYSTLNPDTSSDSPSIKSKGERPISNSKTRFHLMNR